MCLYLEMSKNRTSMSDLSFKPSSRLQPFSAQGIPWDWCYLPYSDGSFFQVPAQSSLLCVQNLLQLSHPLAKTFTDLFCAVWWNISLHFENSSYILKTVATFCFGRGSEQHKPHLPSPHHSGFYRPESVHPPGGLFSRLMSLSLSARSWAFTPMFWLPVSKGLGNSAKRSFCPGSLHILSTTLQPTFIGWTLNFLNITATQILVCANAPKYLICRNPTSWTGHQCSSHLQHSEPEAVVWPQNATCDLKEHINRHTCPQECSSGGLRLIN